LYPNLPAGVTRDEYADRINDALLELNARLDPLFVRERKRKRIAYWVVVVTAIGFALTFPALFSGESGWPSAWSGTVLGVFAGILLLVAHALIERDTARQRNQIRASIDASQSELS
jgi:hypothetical protein